VSNSNNRNSREFRLSISRKYPKEKLGFGTAETRWAEHNNSFVPEGHTPESLLEELKRGHSFCAVLGSCERDHCGQWCCPPRRKANDPTHCGRPQGYRVGWHFVSSQTLALDFDTGNPRLTDLQSDPFIAQYGTIIYSTLSATEEERKWRVVFVLAEPITDASLYCRAETSLLNRFGDSDQSIKDPARFLYGRFPVVSIASWATGRR